MRYIVTFSGGKDSEATCIWAKENLQADWEIVFCDTAWESPLTYKFMIDFESKMGKKVNYLKSKKYKGFIDLTRKKKRFASTKGRFCTQELKVKPMIDFILDQVKEDCRIYQGLRWEESKNRASANKIDDYFLHYFQPIIKVDPKTGKKKESYHTYRKKEVFEFCKHYEATVVRPIISWTGTETIQYILDHSSIIHFMILVLAE